MLSQQVLVFMRIKKTAVVVLSLFVLMTFAAASEDFETLEETDEDIHEEVDVNQIQSDVNNSQDQIPDFVANIVGDEKINVYFVDTDYTYGAELEGTEIKELQEEELEDPTLEVRVNQTSMEAIIDSEQPLDELQTQLDEGEIEYEALTTTNQIRMYITETVLDILSRVGVV